MVVHVEAYKYLRAEFGMPSSNYLRETFFKAIYQLASLDEGDNHKGPAESLWPSMYDALDSPECALPSALFRELPPLSSPGCGSAASRSLMPAH